MKLFDRWAPRLLTGLVFVVPLIFSSAIYDTYDLPKLTLVYTADLLLLVLWLWQGGMSGEWRIRRTVLDIPLVVFLVVTGISTGSSLDPKLSLYGAFRIYSFGGWPLCAFAALYFFTVQAAADISFAKSIRHAACFSAACVGLYAIFQYGGLEIFSSIPAAEGGRVWSSLGNSLYMGVLCAMAVPLILEGWSFGNILPLVLVWAGLLLSLSRSAWVGTFFSCLALAYTHRQAARRWSKPVVGGIFAIGLIVVLMPSIHERLAVLTSSREASNASRVEGWKAGLRVWRHYPILGSGPDTFFQAFRPQRTTAYLQTTGVGITQADAHNDVIQMAATEGLLGLGVYLWIVFLFLRKEFRWNPGAIGFYGASLLALGVQNQFNFSSVATSAWAAVFAGLFFGLEKCTTTEFHRSPIPACRVPLMMLLVSGLWGIARPLRADWHYKQALAWAQGDQFVPALEHDRQAVHLNGRIELYGTSLANTARSAGRLDESWQVAEDQTQRHPSNPDVWNNLGVAAMWMVQLGGQNKWAEAKAAFERATTLDPVFVDAWANLAKWNHLQGHLDEEMRLWKKVLELDPLNDTAAQVLREKR